MIPSQLPIFLKVVEQGSFSAASRQCGISPAAVSKAISQLEKKMQQRLFHRSTHSLTLTQEGKVLYDKTAHLMAELEESIEASIDATQSVAGEIKINLPDHMGQTLIYPRLLEFLKRYPDVQLDLHFNDQVQDLIENGFDLGIGNFINQDSRLIARSYMDVQLVYVASPDYLEGKPLPKTPEELKGLNCISYCSPSTGRLIPWRFVVDGKEQLLMPEGNLKVNSQVQLFGEH
ncbi:transcriptional regulator, lysR family [Vibrio ishigakensis]|uniref:Transcriptional regulator, lysR family n=1 Tax=Vibrio ishigakensis TaxID=1481914 RepID=A0A0B8NPD2_9VIBR|nr:transcriptional regulator, lysR family [Vibrio ishigakensis]